MAVPTPPQLTDAEIATRRRNRRSIAIGLALGLLVVIFYVLTIVKMGPHVFDVPPAP